ncbi:galactose-3-O-sulfotransferase 2 [Cottoperca gobio]|uniref:Galactose-3-O-sulfotransferase 2 n=1 Tax=Cottoperca gobio TaxID=56716 RepID=A0A6J2QXN2_COTGO|nr:galactose-3-O-sulfotransferase 2-like [Cottoperca gobio]
MLSPPRRWIRDQAPSSVTSCVRRGLCSRRHSLWILLILLVVCIAIQTFVARQARNDKLTELPHLRFTVSKQHLFPTEQNVWEGIQSESSLALKEDMKSLQTDRTADLHHHNEGYQKQSHYSLSKLVDILARDSQMEARKVSPGKLLLPKHGTILGLPGSLALHSTWKGVSSRSVREFHIMCNHMRFRKSEVAKVMPEDTFYFSILRHPVAMMESIFIYYKSIPAFHKTHSLDDFLDNSWRNYNSSVTNNHYAHNIVAFDFGFDNNVAAGAEDLEERASIAVAAIERDFHLILISEYFDESMILLKHALCWSLEDVVSFKLNSRSEQTRHPLLTNTAEKIKRWNALDWRIYLHFNTTFWHKVDSLVGQEQMKREVSQLRELQAELAKSCLKDGGAVDPSQIKDAGLKPFQYGAAIIQGYNLNPHIDRQTKIKCQRLITPELQYTDLIYTQQFPELAAKHRQETRKVAPQRQRSDRTGMMGIAWGREAHHRQIIRRKFSNLKNQKASTTALLTHTEANNKTSMP